jgi:hypothetical protein
MFVTAGGLTCSHVDMGEAVQATAHENRVHC